MENMNNFNNISDLSVKPSGVGAVISPSDMFSINLVTDSDTEKYRSVWQQTHYEDTDKNNNVFSINLNDSDTKKYWSVWRQPIMTLPNKKITSTLKILIYKKKSILSDSLQN